MTITFELLQTVLIDGEPVMWQGMLNGQAQDDAISLASTSNASTGVREKVIAAAGNAAIWDKDDAGEACSTINALFILSSQDGVLKLLTTDELDSSDVNTISIHADVVHAIVADSQSASMNGTLKAYGDFGTTDAFAGALENVTRLEFKNNGPDEGTVALLILK